ncbi:hypothetical protein [Streptomyces variabilis]
MTRRIDPRTPQAAATQSATVQACQADRAGRNDALQAAEASVQRAVTVPNPSAGRPFRKG